MKTDTQDVPFNYNVPAVPREERLKRMAMAAGRHVGNLVCYLVLGILTALYRPINWFARVVSVGAVGGLILCLYAHEWHASGILVMVLVTLQATRIGLRRLLRV